MKRVIKFFGLALLVLASVANAKSFDEQNARAELAAHIEHKSEFEQDFYNRLFERELFKGTFRNHGWRFNMLRWMDLVYATELGDKRVAYLLDEHMFAFKKAKAQFPAEMAALEHGKSRAEVISMADAARANGQSAKYRFFERYLPPAQDYLLLRRFNSADFDFDDLAGIGMKIDEVIESNDDFKFHGATDQEKGHAFDEEKLYRYYYKWAKDQVGPPNGELYGRSLEDFQDYYATYMTSMARDQYSFGLNKWNRASRDIQEYWIKAQGNPARLTPYGATNSAVQNQPKPNLSNEPTVASSTPDEIILEEPEKVIEDKLDETIDTVIEEPKKKLKKLFGF